MAARTLTIIGAAIALLAAIIALSATFIIEETEQAIVLRFGEPTDGVRQPGLNFKLPFIDTVRYFDARVLDYDARPEEIPTLDQKQLVVDAFARFRITDPLAFFKAVRDERQVNLRLSSIIASSLRAELGNVPLTRVLTKERSALMAEVEERVNRNTAGFGIEITDVRIKRVDLPTENSKAIFARMKTQRQQEAAKIRAEGDKEAQIIRADADKARRVIIAEARKQAEVLRGEGEGRAQSIYNQAYGVDPEFFDFWRSMRAFKEGLRGDTTSFVGPPDSEFFRFFGDRLPPLRNAGRPVAPAQPSVGQVPAQ